ncbi:RNA polymerase sigma factor [Planctomycetota bacterium]
MEDRYLVLQCKRGCGDALAQIYAKYRKDLLILATVLLCDRAVAEDIVHDVFVHFAETVPTFRLTGSLKGFLLTCVANRARNHNKARRSVIPPLTNSAAEDKKGPVEHLLGNEQVQRLVQALNQLPYEQRETVMLQMYGGMSLRGIAKKLGLSPNTVMSRYRYGLGKLKNLLNGDGDR